jgi:hypothetical protein
LSPINAILKFVPRPILFIYGALEQSLPGARLQLVPPRRAADPNTSAELWVVHDANHGGYLRIVGDEEYARHVLPFLDCSLLAAHCDEYHAFVEYAARAVLFSATCQPTSAFQDKFIASSPDMLKPHFSKPDRSAVMFGNMGIEWACFSCIKILLTLCWQCLCPSIAVQANSQYLAQRSRPKCSLYARHLPIEKNASFEDCPIVQQFVPICHERRFCFWLEKRPSDRDTWVYLMSQNTGRSFQVGCLVAR